MTKLFLNDVVDREPIEISKLQLPFLVITVAKLGQYLTGQHTGKEQFVNENR